MESSKSGQTRQGTTPLKLGIFVIVNCDVIVLLLDAIFYAK